MPMVKQIDAVTVRVVGFRFVLHSLANLMLNAEGECEADGVSDTESSIPQGKSGN